MATNILTGFSHGLGKIFLRKFAQDNPCVIFEQIRMAVANPFTKNSRGLEMNAKFILANLE